MSSSSDSLSTHCYVMPVFDYGESDARLEVQEREHKIQFVDKENTPLEFSYDTVFNDQHDFIKSSFTKCIYPLIQPTIRGESTMVLFGGLQSLKMDEFLLSHTVMQGLISQAAGYLLNSVNVGDDKVGSVTFSWFKIDCGSPEVLTDVLKTASSSHGGKADSGSLVLRELGKGRGMVVPGLWEVEIAGGGDIEAVINHLQKIVPEAADHSAGGAHTVMQLTVTDNRKTAPDTPRTHTAVGALSDGPGVGRITFVLLSNLSPQAAAGSRSSSPMKSPSMKSPSTPSPPTKSGNYAWVDHCRQVIQWLESKRASTPFHKSRLLLLLKDVLLRRQKASLLLMVQPSLEQHANNLEWMRLVAQMSKDYTALGSADPGRAPGTPASRGTGMGMGMERDGLGSMPAARGGGDVASRSASASRARARTPTRPPPTLQVQTQMARSGSGSSGGGGGSRTTTPTGALRRRNSQSAGTLGAAGAAQGGGSSSGQKGTQGLQGMQGMQGAGLQGMGTPGAGSSSGGEDSFYASSIENMNHIARANASANASSRKEALLRSNSMRGSFRRPSLSQPHSQSSLDLGVPVTVDDVEVTQTERALHVALDAAQSEASALKLAYHYSSDKYNELKLSHEALLEQLREEGAFLVKRDRDRYRSALKDLKDYEIYKQVMEAAMVRMQQELEIYAEENQTIKAAKVQGERQSRKARDFNDKYSKDLVATRKRLEEAQEAAAKREVRMKALAKEKEAAVLTLAQLKSTGAQQAGTQRMAAELGATERHEMQARLARAEERGRSLQADREALLASSATEAATLRAAHSKALEMLMGYQEENDALRAALSDAGISATPAPPAAKAETKSAADLDLPPPAPGGKRAME
ncbi:hypothetical protein B484DRAFT_420893 [Ochromonadaceae sp. CCMP2298]|nr:hypothetical protein B484DRAFT_420893 [Ochromonadaceae sp. CCMP2298]